MPRTNATLVAGVIELDTAIDVTPFIEVASSLVDEIAQLSHSPNDARLLQIETWLSAHFYCTRDPRADMEKAGSVSAKYQSSVEVGLGNSQYGQMAMVLDPTGFLRARSLGQRRRVSVGWLGKTKSEISLETGQCE